MFENVSQLKLVMWLILCLSIGFVAAEFYSNDQFESNYELNKVNKGIWHRFNRLQEAPVVAGKFMFRSVSNEEEILNPMDGISPLDRKKRAASSKSRKRHIKNIKQTTPDIKNSLFNDLPLGVAMLLENSNNKNDDYSGYPKYETKFFNNNNETSELTETIQHTEPKENKTKEYDLLNDLDNIINDTEGNATSKRSMNYDQLVVDKIDFLEMFNRSKDFNKVQIVNEDQMWQTAPVDTNLYEVLPKGPKTDIENRKHVTERGLIKVMSMLTKTFRKIMKQHNAIKIIHDEIKNVDTNFKAKIDTNEKKLVEFDGKYMDIMKVMDKLKNFQECLKNKEEMYKHKEALISKNLLDFESQQKKFLAQQQQFYNIQKMMLAQNDKINEKQNSIAKMQNEISHRQNQFAKVLKKAKLALRLNKNFKINSVTVRPEQKLSKPNTTQKESKLTTVTTSTAAPVTINLFSIAPVNVVKNPDKMILKEKDDHPVDDLIYKYYFNNTFIDTVIKNKILGGVLFGDKTTIARDAKLAAKRNQHKSKNTTQPETTIMLPVSKPILKRERRWINHHSNRRHRKRLYSKGRLPEENKDENKVASTTPKMVKESDAIANDPFLSMATHFCKEIGQSNTKQILDWCVEKAIRRLRSMDTKMMPPPAMVQPQTTENAKQSTIPVSATTPTKSNQFSMERSHYFRKNLTSAMQDLYGCAEPVVQNAAFTTVPVQVTGQKQNAIYPIMPVAQPSKTKLTGFYYDNKAFPDNDELETNLKQFDLTPDTAGNVYYDGSLHASQMINDKSDGVSDILPDFDSNSKIDIDARVVQMQMRRKYMRENMPQNVWKT